MEIDDYRSQIKLSPYYEFIRKNHEQLEGDILEVGVYRGKSLLSTAMLLKELGSDKKVYGFDSFSGFPPVYHENDDPCAFNQLHTSGKITDAHLEAHNKLMKMTEFKKGFVPNAQTISTSNNFADTSDAVLEKKAKHLGLDNVVLVKGDFNETMQADQHLETRFMAVLMDCDLYASHVVALPFAWDRMVTKSLMFLDEYYSLKFPGARIACDEFFSKKTKSPHNILFRKENLNVGMQSKIR